MSVLYQLATGGAIPVILSVSGVWFLWYLRGAPFRSPRGMIRAMCEKRPGGVSPFRAVTLALAGTLGVGNIVGVANAIRIGGAGAVLWMWVSALLAMILKYAEITLAVRHRRIGRDGSYSGGAPCYIRDGFPRHPAMGRLLAVVFSGLLILNALSMGCVIQVNAVASAMRGVWNFPVAVCAIVLLLLTAPVILRGARSVLNVTGYLVPIMSLGFLILSAAVLILRRDAVPGAFASIFRDAFSPLGMGGGVIGFLTSRSLRVGTMRGLLSNEAGCGTAPTAHAGANTDSPAAQGVWGVFEVFADTILLCTVTALVILVNYDAAIPYGNDPMMMTVAAFSESLGEGAGWFLSAAILCFGYATLLCWSGYGVSAVREITAHPRAEHSFLAAFLLCIPIGCAVAPDAVWTVSDLAIAALTTLNVTALLHMRREIREETIRRFPLRRQQKDPNRRRGRENKPATDMRKKPSGQAADTGKTQRDPDRTGGKIGEIGQDLGTERVLTDADDRDRAEVRIVPGRCKRDPERQDRL